jgi:hypothetical protein
MPREEIEARLEAMRASHPVAELAFYAYRDLSRTDWGPFLHASLERSPVCVQACRELSDSEVAERIAALPSESIYGGPRAAQPDEVWNFQRGDGFEKAVCLATVWRARHPGRPMRMETEPGRVRLTGGPIPIDWPSDKPLAGSADL